MILLRPDRFTANGPANRKDLIARMAADLFRVGIPADETDTIRMLCLLDYRFRDATALAEDALFAARELAVAVSVSETPQSPIPAKASQAPPLEAVLTAPGSKDSGFLSTSLALLTLEAPLAWRDPETGA